MRKRKWLAIAIAAALTSVHSWSEGSICAAANEQQSEAHHLTETVVEAPAQNSQADS